MNKSKNKILRVGDLVQWSPSVSNSKHNEVGIVLEFVGPDIKRQQALEIIVYFPSGIKTQYLPTTSTDENLYPFITI